jgi:hypothetical protein
MKKERCLAWLSGQKSSKKKLGPKSIASFTVCPMLTHDDDKNDIYPFLAKKFHM